MKRLRVCHTEVALTRMTSFFFFNDTATTEIYTLSLHDALPIWPGARNRPRRLPECRAAVLSAAERQDLRAAAGLGDLPAEGRRRGRLHGRRGVHHHGRSALVAERGLVPEAAGGARPRVARRGRIRRVPRAARLPPARFLAPRGG